MSEVELARKPESREKSFSPNFPVTGTGRDYIVQLDGIRFLAVAGVLFGHWVEAPYLKHLTTFVAAESVHLFFVLSGFLITRILLQNKIKAAASPLKVLRQFYIRRVLRIFPLYYFVLFMGVVFSIPYAKEYFWWFFTYTANIKIGLINGFAGYYSHLWSLAVEEQFYIFFPLLILFFPVRHHLKLFLLLIAGAIVSRIMIYFYFSSPGSVIWVSYTFTTACFDCFAVGALLAYLQVYKRELLQRLLKRSYIFLFFLLLTIALYIFDFINKPGLVFIATGRTLFSLFVFWLIGKASSPGFKGVIGKFFEYPPVIYLGKISYGIYVYHYLVPWLFQKAGFNHFSGEKFFFLAVTIIIASASWHFFENPINRLKRYVSYGSPINNHALPVR